MTEIFNLKEVAKMLKVSERTVSRLLDRKEINGFKVGRSWRLVQADIDAYIAAQRQAAAQSQ